jgi:emfourin
VRIEVTRSGGFAGIGRTAAVHTSGRADGPFLEALAREVTAQAPRSGAHGVPDGFSYEITVDGRTVQCADPHLTPAQRELITAVLGEGA